MTKNSKIKLLFFTPYAGYTGSEMMLLHLLNSLNKEQFEVQLFAQRKGELLTLFPSHIKTDYSKTTTSIFWRLMDKIITKLGGKSIEDRQILKIQQTFKPDCWYINTMVMSTVVNLAISQKQKYIVHFHELLSQYDYVSGSDFQQMIANAYYTVGCSTSVCDNLRILGSKSIHKHYECVDITKINPFHDVDKLKTQLTIPRESTVITMSGQRIDRKGFDIFIETAIRFKQNNKFHFLWLGQSRNSGYEHFLSQLISDQNLTNISIIAPNHDEYYSYLNLTDIFFLTSREDPFPLVMIEAGFLGKPILTFKSGGGIEFATEKTGRIIEDFSESSIDEALFKITESLKLDFFEKSEIKNNALQYSSENQAKLFENWMIELFYTPKC